MYRRLKRLKQFYLTSNNTIENDVDLHKKHAVVLISNFHVDDQLCLSQPLSIHIFYYDCLQVSSALSNVFFNSIVIVIGPTPPGTGVTAPDFSNTRS